MVYRTDPARYDGRYPEPPYDVGDDATVELAVQLTERDAEIERLRDIIADIIAAYDAKQLEMHSPDIAADGGMPPYYWHEEWLHYARQEIAPTPPTKARE